MYSRSDDFEMHQVCPVWDELIFVKCHYCQSSLLPTAIKNHVEMRHIGKVRYEKDPEFSIFRKKTSLPLSAISNHFPTSVNVENSSLKTTLCSTNMSSDQLPQIAEHFIGWRNSLDGAVQQSSLNVGVSLELENRTTKAAIPTPIKNTAQHKIMPDISFTVLLPKVEKEEPFNQTFSFSAANAMSDTLKKPPLFDVPSSYYDLSSIDNNQPCSASCDQPSKKKLLMSSQDNLLYKQHSKPKPALAYESISAGRTAFEEGFQASYLSPLMAPTSRELEEQKPAVEKLVLRRVLQTAKSTEGQSLQGPKSSSKNKKDSFQPYFMVVRNRDHQQNASANQKTRKHTASHKEKDKEKQKLKKLENHKKKHLKQCLKKLQSIKQSLEINDRSKQETERKIILFKAELDEFQRKRDFQNEASLKQSVKYEKEISELKQRNEELTNSLEQAQVYGDLGLHPWEERLELQRRIDKLHCEAQEYKNAAYMQGAQFREKEKQLFNVINDLKKRLDEEIAKSEELKMQRDIFGQHLPPEVCSQVRRRLVATCPPDTLPLHYLDTRLSSESPQVFQQQQEKPCKLF